MLNRISILVGIYILCAVASYPQITPAPNENDDVEKVYTEEIKVPVSVFDNLGKPFSGIEKEDLLVMDNDRLSKVSSIKKVPAHILIVMDTGGELKLGKNLNQTQKAVEKFVSLLAPDDEAAIMQYHDKVEFLTEWETDKNNLIKTLKSKANFGRRSLFFKAIIESFNFLKNSAVENSHVVFITDGLDTFNDQTQINEAMRKFLDLNTSVHIISYTKLETEELKKSSLFRKDIKIINLDKEMIKFYKGRLNAVLESEKNLMKLAQDTNGEFVLPESYEDLINEVKMVSERIAATYVITYEPQKPLQDSPAGEIREIKVFSRRPGTSAYGNRQLILTKN